MRLWTASKVIRDNLSTTIIVGVVAAEDMNVAREEFFSKTGHRDDVQIDEGVDLTDDLIVGLFNINLLNRIIEAAPYAKGIHVFGEFNVEF